MIQLTHKIAGVAALALAALPLAAIPAIAQAAPATVAIADLDLNTAHGQAEFQSRVRKAAQKFCADRVVTGTRIANTRSCVAGVEAEMMEKLAQQVGAPKTLAQR